MKEIYAWVPWFQELAEKIADGGEAYLIKRAKRVDWREEPGKKPPLLDFGDENIDPFSFFYFLAQKNTKHQRKRVFSSAHKEFQINNELPDAEDDEQWIFPTPTSHTPALFHSGKEESFEPEKLWRVFRKAIKQPPSFDKNELQEILVIPKVGVAKLTQALFLINPHYFLTVDSVSLELLQELRGNRSKFDIENSIKNEGWEYYRALIEYYKSRFPRQECYKINYKMYTKNEVSHWLVGAVLDTDKTSQFVEEGRWENGYAGGSKKRNEEELVKQIRVGDRIAIKSSFKRKYDLPFDYGGKDCSVIQIKHLGTVTENPGDGQHIKVDWEEKREERKYWYARTRPKMRTIHELGKKDDASLIDFVFYGHEQNYDESIAPEKDNGENTMNSLNRILYGPPGTGKTWNTVNHALAIIKKKSVKEFEEESQGDRGEVKRHFDKFKETGQIEMVTFHQNFAYEDFIEGIKPRMADDEDIDNLQYEIVDGVFKRISKVAQKNMAQPSNEEFDLDDLLQDFSDSIDEEIESGKKVRLHKHSTTSQGTIIRVRRFSDGEFRSFLIEFGISKQSLTKRIFERDYRNFYQGKIKDYKDIQPKLKSTRRHHGNARYYFAMMEKIKEFHDHWKLAKSFVKPTRKNYVLIIDEINRGNIAKIFGELITLIEPSKRIGGDDDTTITLPYSKEEFSVPDNLYIIGTMNTADRSIALLDTALRRRFDFIEMMPDPHHSDISENIEGVNCQTLLSVMNKRITALLDREHQIGHSYLIDVDSREKLAHVFQNQIIPLLQEYFYDDWAKIDLVLNKNGFVGGHKIESGLFSDMDLVNTDRNIYELIGATDSKWKAPESYKKIYDQREAEDKP